MYVKTMFDSSLVSDLLTHRLVLCSKTHCNYQKVNVVISKVNIRIFIHELLKKCVHTMGNNTLMYPDYMYYHILYLLLESLETKLS